MSKGSSCYCPVSGGGNEDNPRLTTTSSDSLPSQSHPRIKKSLVVVGHLGCFHSFAIVNSAAITWVCRCLCNNFSCISSGISLRVELLDQMADLCLVF
jgi:hypothetical protein